MIQHNQIIACVITPTFNIHLACHSFCFKCFGNPTNCSQCVAQKGLGLSNSECVCTIEKGFYLQNTSNPLIQYCLPCHSFCAACNGSTNSDCLSCSTFPFLGKINGTTCNCIANYVQSYNSITNAYQCQTCNPICTHCFGTSTSQCTSCITKPGVVFILPSTCQCKTGFYLDIQSTSCLQCNTLCANCYGSESNQCIGCSSLAYQIDGSPSVCVNLCPKGYSAQSGICIRKIYLNYLIECDPACKTCSGKQSNNCILCSNPNQVQLQGICYGSCPNHYFSLEGICNCNIKHLTFY